MKKLYVTIAFIAFCFAGIGQLEYQSLEFNNVNALLSNGGVFFNDTDAAAPGYEVPKGSGNHGIYSMSFWFGGEDINGQRKIAATTYEQEGDFFPGALTASGDATLPEAEEATKQIYLISQSQIDYHIANYEDLLYVMPSVIADWPAHGDPSYDLAFYLAPFEDVDGNGLYEPDLGDYPLIKGDQAAFMILNDKGGIHASGGEPIGLEMHLLFYQYAGDDFINNTTYVNMRIINRGTQTLFNFHSACFVDGDLGQSSDDHVGFNSDANVMYTYNASNFDADYGENPPAIGVTLMNREVNKFASIGTSPGAMGMPVIGLDYYNYMAGRWLDGTSFTYGGNGYGGDVETDFLYDGLPTADTWSEVSEENPGGERKMMMSNQHYGGVFRPFEELCYDYAIVYSAEGDHLENVANVVELAEDAKAFYLSDGEPYCNSIVLGIDESKTSLAFDVYPNPSTGTFTIEADGVYTASIYALDGRQVYRSTELEGNSIIQTEFANGTYLVVVDHANGEVSNQLIVINK
ncbi:MAG: hypothetical protein ACI8ZM_004897 [Crocinitomix sp.]|jgi:hypothetical protein